MQWQTPLVLFNFNLPSNSLAGSRASVCDKPNGWGLADESQRLGFRRSLYRSRAVATERSDSLRQRNSVHNGPYRTVSIAQIPVQAASNEAPPELTRAVCPVPICHEDGPANAQSQARCRQITLQHSAPVIAGIVAPNILALAPEADLPSALFASKHACG